MPCPTETDGSSGACTAGGGLGDPSFRMWAFGQRRLAVKETLDSFFFFTMYCDTTVLLFDLETSFCPWRTFSGTQRAGAAPEVLQARRGRCVLPGCWRLSVEGRAAVRGLGASSAAAGWQSGRVFSDTVTSTSKVGTARATSRLQPEQLVLLAHAKEYRSSSCLYKHRHGRGSVTQMPQL